MHDSIYGDILYHARVRPAAPAIHFGHDVSYARFARDIEAFTRRLAKEGLAPGTRVVVHVGGKYLQWLVLLACVRLGLPSASVGDASELALPRATVCISNLPADKLKFAGRVVNVQRTWADEALEGEWEDPEHHAGDLCRMVLSSGTTGTPKNVGITYAQLRQRCALGVCTYGLSPQSRLLVAMGAVTAGGFVMPCMAWMAGAAVIVPQASLAEAWRDTNPTVMLVSPARLPELLEALPPFGAARANLDLYVAGAALPPAQNERVRLAITPSLYICYGSTEISTGTIMHAAEAGARHGCIGYPPSYVQAQVVDEQHRIVAAGVEGLVRFRAEGMADGYLDDPVATAASFREGWFYPGDRGVLEASGLMRLTGRTSEIANLGGEKVSPEEVDSALTGFAGTRELAAFAVTRDGADEMWIAVVTAGDAFDEEPLKAAYRREFPRCPPPRVMRAQSIPRNEMGKVQRGELRKTAQAAPP